MSKHIDTTLGANEVRYFPDSGRFVWLDVPCRPSLNGKDATHLTTNGYLYIKAAQRNHSASRLAYKLYYGKDPGELEIDHINRIKTDNRPSNLRLATRRQNIANRVVRPNRLGVLGVSLFRKGQCYRARHRNKTTYHKTLEEAERGYATLVSTELHELSKDA